MPPTLAVLIPADHDKSTHHHPQRPPITDLPAISQQPRAKGALRLDVKSTPHGSALARLEQSGASRMLFPTGKTVEGIILNTAGGVTGGDRFTLSAKIATGAEARLTTQACERLYRAKDPAPGRIDTQVEIGAGGRLDWLPQETILFDGARIRRRFVADLAEGARLLFVEPLIFGRLAMGEALRNAHLRDDVMLRRAGQPLLRDTTELRGDIAALLDRPAIGHGARATALMLYAAPDAEAHLTPLRRLTQGVSLIRDGLLALRVLAKDGYALRQSLVPLLTHFTPLPRCWSL